MENLTSYFIGALSGVALMATNELVWGGGRSDQRRAPPITGRVDQTINSTERNKNLKLKSHPYDENLGDGPELSKGPLGTGQIGTSSTPGIDKPFQRPGGQAAITSRKGNGPAAA
ncbi:hypothetical protein GEV33_005934 [Tenebrio molitor]|uniref:Uncharacterized protein n=1 Tax=Tenebrio molitor TaxID=7067 RepID=A0A8J6HKS1_TENMO|nr:hypothetical protein GEV33_005934 [Tenebrio molitor]